MTIKNIDVTSDCFHSGSQVRTSDGKLVTFKLVCFADEEPTVSLKGIQPGTKFRSRKGDVYIFEGAKLNHAHLFARKLTGEGLYYLEDGRCNIGDGQDDVVEILGPTLLNQIERQAAKLDPADIDRIILSSDDWSTVMKEAKGSSAYRNGLIFAGEVRVFHSSNVPEGGFSIQLKLR